MEKENIHKDHRSRLRRRYQTDGLASFEDHNVLELLLFYAIPRRDTNPIAHRLLEEFGSLSGVFRATEEELVAVDGIGESTAQFIALCPKVARRIRLDAICSEPLNSNSRLGTFFVCALEDTPPETAIALLLDRELKTIKSVMINYGDTYRARSVVEECIAASIKYSPAYVVLGHNHGDAGCEPSAYDITATEHIREALAERSVSLLGHFVISGFDFMNFLSRNYGERNSNDL